MGAARGRSSLSRAGGRRTCGSAWRGGWEGSGELGFGIWAGSTMVGRQVKTKLRGVWVGGYVVLLYLFELPSHPYLPCPPPLPPPPPHGLVRIAGRRHLPAPDAPSRCPTPTAALEAPRSRSRHISSLTVTASFSPVSVVLSNSLPTPTYSSERAQPAGSARGRARRRRIPPSRRCRALPPRAIERGPESREVAIGRRPAS
jgi:hypothetical protein